jgi:hypothetical protein
MSGQQLDPITREALWAAHGRRCAYTHELLDLASMHVDHILPESLSNDTALQFETFRRLGLPEEFSITGLENLLPCKPGANLKKSSTIFPDSSVYYLLGVGATKKPVVLENIASIQRRLDTGRAVVLYQQLFASGTVSHDDLIRLAIDPTAEILRLSRKFETGGGTVLDAIARADIQELLDAPFKPGGNESVDGITLRTEAGAQTFVRSCTEYYAALNAGYSPYTSFDMKMAAFFEQRCGLLQALRTARISVNSYLSHPYVALADLDLLPSDLFPDLEGGFDGGRLAHSTYQDLLDSGVLAVKRIGSTIVHVEAAGMGQRLVELARADFDGDGFEELLVHDYSYAVQGTYGYGTALILGRSSPNGPFEIRQA